MPRKPKLKVTKVTALLPYSVDLTKLRSNNTLDIQVRSGDIHIPKIPGVEPLRVVCEEFVRCVADGLEQTAHAVFDRDVLHLSFAGVTATFTDVLLARNDAGAGPASGAALAPMTGTIAAVRVEAGEQVRKGQCLVILEAMKMEHEILAPRDGTVAAVLVAVGQQVTTRKILVQLAQRAAE